MKITNYGDIFFNHQSLFIYIYSFFSTMVEAHGCGPLSYSADSMRPVVDL